ncbi:MAG: hypothetical protein KAJ22_02065 [Candidatus Izimaplasma sp.]|nr:hypothetical protein [Candidatus Izimaplasma bacterium]
MQKDKKMYNKSNTICIRLNRDELEKLEYIRIKFRLRDYSKALRKLIDDEFSRH